MDSKGFTLIEIISIIIILGILLVIVVPNVFETIDNSKLDIYEVKEDKIVQGSKDYVIYNNTLLPENIGQRINIQLTDLVEGEFVSKIYDMTDNSLCVGYVYIEKTNSNNFSYNPCLFCTNYQTDNAQCSSSEVE